MRKISMLLVFALIINLFVFVPTNAASLTDLVTSSTKVWATTGWGGDTVPYAVDGNYTTELNQGVHGVTDTTIRLKISGDNSKKYNKAKIYVTRWNSKKFALEASDTLNGTEPTTTLSDVLLSNPTTLYTETFPSNRYNGYVGNNVVTMSFNTTNSKYVALRTYNVSNTELGLGIGEIELFYATPSSIAISNVPVKVANGADKTISAKASVLDAVGDAIKDSAFKGVKWSLNAAAKGVTINSSTGVVTISKDAPEQTVTVIATSTASGYTSVKGTKSFKIVSGNDYYIADFGDGEEIKDWLQVTDKPGLERSQAITRGTSKYSAKYARTTSTAWVESPAFTAMDWTKYSYVNMWVYSETANNATVMFIPYDKTQASSSQSEYFKKNVTIDWTGWKLLSLPLSSFSANVTTASLSSIYKFDIVMSGWGVTAVDSTALYFDSIWLSKTQPKANSYSKISLKKTNPNVIRASVKTNIGIEGTDLILAIGAYESGKLKNVSYATTSNRYGEMHLQASVNYTDGQEVKALLFEDLEKLAVVQQETVYGAKDDIWMPSIFSNEAVLQRGMNLNIWGTAPKGATVKVELGGKTYSATANSSTGKWSVKTNPIDVEGNPYTMTITTSTGGKKVLTDLLAGEVWLCSGQSNMEYKISQTSHSSTEPNLTLDDNIRVFRQAKSGTENPETDVKDGNWKNLSPKVVSDFSAVGYLFGKNIKKNLDVPVGLIYAAYGGSVIEAWTSNEALKASPYPDRANVTVADDANRDASHLFNKMINPIIPYTIKGCIWYQGCTNHTRHYEYLGLQKAWIEDWRDRWGYDFPVIITQLAGYGDAGRETFALLREEQRKFANEYADKGVYMAVILDGGEQNNIHPADKTKPGDRLARIALGAVYGQNVQYKYPKPQSYEISGDTVTLTFYSDTVYDGLRIGADGKGTKLNSFEVTPDGNNWYSATATISGKNKVIIKSSHVSKPVGFRAGFYHWPNPMYNLYNSAGLLATPFIHGKYTAGSLGTFVK